MLISQKEIEDKLGVKAIEDLADIVAEYLIEAGFRPIAFDYTLSVEFEEE